MKAWRWELSQSSNPAFSTAYMEAMLGQVNENNVGFWWKRRVGYSFLTFFPSLQITSETDQMQWCEILHHGRTYS